jgi:hypothetical protein
MSRELLQQALNALRRVGEYGDIYRYKNTEQSPYTQIYEAIDAINVELAKPEQAARKTLIECIAGSISMHMTIGLYPKELLAAAEYIVDNYTAPPRKEWVGLTNDEINDFSAGCHLVKSVQSAICQAAAKLKELNK